LDKNVCSDGPVAIALAGLLLVACQQPTAASVEASVQARVAATVTALSVTAPAKPSLSPVPSPTAAAPTAAMLPYSVEQANFRITLLDVAQYPERQRTLAGYHFVQVRIRFDNLLQRQNNSPGCVGFAKLRINTDHGNIYGPADAGYDLVGIMRPSSDVTARIGFEIRDTERPVELWAWRHRYDPVRPSYRTCWQPNEDDLPELVFAILGP